MQSGISASQELTSKFTDLLQSDEHFGLLATIENESLTPVSLLTPTSSSATFADNVNSLVLPALADSEPLYLLLKRYDSAPRLTAVSYIPDTAKVRQKMLFASTRLTLVRELGREHFRETIYATTRDELTPEGFDKHDKHEQLEAPLTEEERSLEGVKKAEAEGSRGTGSREIHLGQRMNMPVQEDALAALQELKTEGGRSLVTLKINPETEKVELVPDSSSPTSITDLVSGISTTEPRFTFFRYEHEYGGYKGAPLLFFYTCPVTPGRRAIKDRMLYPLMKRAVLEMASGECGLEVEKKFEVEEPSEITEDVVISELHPKVEARKGFSRPKRPGR
ncbi:cofilin tropomyosin-type actin-binding protein [Diaporthe amygdali]|uniref:cofilin tropomyosin-type actin-binding protein n=1 Tax=Phomopsis amygdali TaxID=1214568 RepID=UPI0022FF28A3|nr:cofilin tropomyosin-type actin-binding protein [Diaporthe amygdali]KAJ0109673.1 cofilin tropomyosin-type actin-binding protein [Diaporthe amygdali]